MSLCVIMIIGGPACLVQVKEDMFVIFLPVQSFSLNILNILLNTFIEHIHGVEYLVRNENS